MSTSTAPVRHLCTIRSPRRSAGPSPRARPAKDIAAVLGVNKNTVLRALHLLRDEGLLEFRRSRSITMSGTPPYGAVQTWLDDMGVRYVLQSERMGHEVPGMRGVYSHITPGMRAELRAGLQELWEGSLRDRARFSPVSAVAVLDDLLAPYREDAPRIRSQNGADGPPDGAQ